MKKKLTKSVPTVSDRANQSEDRDNFSSNSFIKTDWGLHFTEIWIGLFIIAIFQLVIIRLRLPFVHALPGWFWGFDRYNPQPFTFSKAYLLSALFSGIIVVFVMLRPEKIVRNLVLWF